MMKKYVVTIDQQSKYLGLPWTEDAWRGLELHRRILVPRPRPGLGLEEDDGVGQLRGVRPRPQRVAEPRNLDVEGIQEPASVICQHLSFILTFLGIYETSCVRLISICPKCQLLPVHNQFKGCIYFHILLVNRPHEDPWWHR